MLLTSVESVREAIRFDDIDEINTAIENGLQSATADLSNILRTDFKRQVNTDIFFITSGVSMNDADQEFFRLKNGFVDSIAAFQFGTSDSRVGLNNITSVIDFCSIDYENGLISYLGDPIINKFFKCVYTSGFEVDPTDPNVYNQEQVPDWLRQAAITGAIMHMDMVSPTLRNDSADDVNSEEMQSKYDLLVRPHIRYWPKYKNPSM